MILDRHGPKVLGSYSLSTPVNLVLGSSIVTETPIVDMHFKGPSTVLSHDNPFGRSSGTSLSLTITGSTLVSSV